MMNKMIDKVKSIVIDLCKNQKWDWKNHVETVVKYSKILAKKLNADEEIVEIAAWLHDIIKIKEGIRENHHVLGSEEAEQILKNLGYPKDRIEKVKECILTHSSDENYPPKTKEAKIVANADALSHFENFLDLAFFAYNLRKENIPTAREWLIEKYKSCWKKLTIPEAKEIAKNKYEVIKKILNE